MNKYWSKVRADEVDEQGNTALHLASQGDHKEVCIIGCPNILLCLQYIYFSDRGEYALRYILRFCAEIDTQYMC